MLRIQKYVDQLVQRLLGVRKEKRKHNTGQNYEQGVPLRQMTLAL